MWICQRFRRLPNESKGVGGDVKNEKRGNHRRERREVLLCFADRFGLVGCSFYRKYKME